MARNPNAPAETPDPGAEPAEDPTARGIVECLRMLAEEATALRLGRTTAALCAAIEVCAAESDPWMVSLSPGTRLH